MSKTKRVRLHSRDGTPIGWCHPAQARQLESDGTAAWEDSRLTLTEGHALDHRWFPSRFDIGDPVYVEAQGHKLEGIIRTVTFTNGKVRYSVRVPLDNDNVAETLTTLHNLDSIMVTPREGRKIQFESVDNYS